VSLTGGNRNDVTQLMPLVQAIPPVRGRRGRPTATSFLPIRPRLSCDIPTRGTTGL
jgi:hypothetical protein